MNVLNFIYIDLFVFMTDSPTRHTSAADSAGRLAQAQTELLCPALQEVELAIGHLCPLSD